MSVCGLAVLVPRAVGAHLVLGREHQRAGRAHLDAVAAVHARRVGQLDGVLGGDAGVEAPPGDADRQRLLPLLAAGVDALVAEDALGVVAHVERVVDLDRLVDGLGRCHRRDVVVPGGARRRGRRPAAQAARTAPASAPYSLVPAIHALRSATGRPTSPAARAPAAGCGASARCRCARPCRPRRAASSDGTSTREPSTSTMHTRQAFFGVIVSP